ncbi:MAG: FtsX-like permease family protein, partial [Candidatus Cloacimonadaceae bacterium]
RNELMLVKGTAMAATVCFGIDLDRQRKVSPILLPLSPEELNRPSQQWIQGIISGRTSPEKFERDGIILGSELAQSINASVGDSLRLLAPLGTIPTPLGMLPRTRSVRVDAIFIAGMPEYDRLYSYVPLSVGQYFSAYDDAIDHFDLKSTNPKRLFQTTRLLQKDFPAFKTENWSSFDTGLYRAMRFEKYLMLVVLGLMFVLASFNMTGNIFKTIVQKRKAIGILKTIGYKDAEVVGVFLRQGLLIGLAGILTGVLFALLILTIQSKFSLIQLPVGNMPNLILPVDLRLADFIIIPLIALAVICFSIYLPARQAGKINPISLIREIT